MCMVRYFFFLFGAFFLAAAFFFGAAFLLAGAFFFGAAFFLAGAFFLAAAFFFGAAFFLAGAFFFGVAFFLAGAFFFAGAFLAAGAAFFVAAFAGFALVGGLSSTGSAFFGAGTKGLEGYVNTRESAECPVTGSPWNLDYQPCVLHINTEHTSGRWLGVESAFKKQTNKTVFLLRDPSRTRSESKRDPW